MQIYLNWELKLGTQIFGRRISGGISTLQSISGTKIDRKATFISMITFSWSKESEAVSNIVEQSCDLLFEVVFNLNCQLLIPRYLQQMKSVSVQNRFFWVVEI